MAFIRLSRSRNTSSYYLVESYRDEQGKSRKRNLCYLGREQDGTDTLEKALAHWKEIEKHARRELASAHGARRRILQDRVAKAKQRLALLRLHIKKAASEEAARRERRQRLEAQVEARRRQLEEQEHWQAIERLRRHPSADNAQAAKRAFRQLALRLHPDQGGSHHEFVRLKDAYDRAQAVWRRLAA